MNGIPTTMNPKGVTLQFFYTSPGSMINVVAWAQRWEYSHMGPLIAYPPVYPRREEFSDGLGVTFNGLSYFESIWKQDPETGKTGVRGPLPIGNLFEWVTGKAEPIIQWFEGNTPHERWCYGIEGRKMLIQDVPPLPGQTRRMIHTCIKAVPTIKYAKYQTGFQQGLHQFFGWNRPAWADSPNSWNCSETSSRGLCPKILIEGLDMGGRNMYDTVSPKDVHDGIDTYWAQIDRT
jgi:hypothetical protein